MSIRVRCKATGEHGMSDQFFKVGRSYYKSKSVYKHYQEEQIAKKNIYNFFIHNVFFGTDIPSHTKTKLTKLSKQYSYGTIWFALESNKKSIEYALNKNLNPNDTFKYILVILNNILGYEAVVFEKFRQNKARTEVQNMIQGEILADISDKLDIRRSKPSVAKTNSGSSKKSIKEIRNSLSDLRSSGISVFGLNKNNREAINCQINKKKFR